MFEWKSEYTCFNEDIDNQHKKLLLLVSQLYEIVRLKDGYDHFDQIVAIFNELSEYTVYHFNFEEELFARNNYDASEVKLHKLEHSSFIKKVSEIDLREVDENQRGISLEIVMFIIKWIEDHILATDKKFGNYYKSLA